MLAQLPHQPWPPTGQAQGGPAGQAGQASPGDEAGDLAHEEAEEGLEYAEPEYSWEQLGDALGAQQQQQQQPQQQQPQQQQAQTPGAQQHAAAQQPTLNANANAAPLVMLIGEGQARPALPPPPLARHHHHHHPHHHHHHPHLLSSCTPTLATTPTLP